MQGHRRYLLIVSAVLVVLALQVGVGHGFVRSSPIDPDADAFGSGGVVTTQIGGAAQIDGFTVAADGSIVATGESLAADAKIRFTALRYASDGTLDPTFGQETVLSGGQPISAVSSALSDGSDVANAVALSPTTGAVVVAGFSIVGDRRQLDIVRYLPDGTFDPSFGPQANGVVTRSRDFLYPLAVAVQSDDSIIVVGVTSQDSGSKVVVIHILADGDLDTAFGNPAAGWDPGFVPIDVAADAVAITLPSGTQPLRIAAINSTAISEIALDQRGAVVPPLVTHRLVIPALDVVNGLARANDGGFLIAGVAQNRFALARYDKNGLPDSAFGPAGVTTPPFGGDGDAAYGVAQQPNGKIVLAGRIANNFALVRLLGDYQSPAAPTGAASPSAASPTASPSPTASASPNAAPSPGSGAGQSGSRIIPRSAQRSDGMPEVARPSSPSIGGRGAPSRETSSSLLGRLLHELTAALR